MRLQGSEWILPTFPDFEWSHDGVLCFCRSDRELKVVPSLWGAIWGATNSAKTSPCDFHHFSFAISPTPVNDGFSKGFIERISCCRFNSRNECTYFIYQTVASTSLHLPVSIPVPLSLASTSLLSGPPLPSQGPPLPSHSIHPLTVVSLTDPTILVPPHLDHASLILPPPSASFPLLALEDSAPVALHPSIVSPNIGSHHSLAGEFISLSVYRPFQYETPAKVFCLFWVCIIFIHNMFLFGQRTSSSISESSSSATKKFWSHTSHATSYVTLAPNLVSSKSSLTSAHTHKQTVEDVNFQGYYLIHHDQFFHQLFNSPCHDCRKSRNVHNLQKSGSLIYCHLACHDCQRCSFFCNIPTKHGAISCKDNNYFNSKSQIYRVLFFSVKI